MSDDGLERLEDLSPGKRVILRGILREQQEEGEAGGAA